MSAAKRLARLELRRDKAILRVIEAKTRDSRRRGLYWARIWAAGIVGPGAASTDGVAQALAEDQAAREQGAAEQAVELERDREADDAADTASAAHGRSER